MQIRFTVAVELTRTEGRFASKAEFIEELTGLLEGADPDMLEGENGGVYSVTSWEVVAEG